jgi:hypothetical protein
MAYQYASEDPLTVAVEIFSLALILASFVVITYLTYRIRSRRTFQFEMFLFTVVLVAAEVPRVLYSLHVIDLDALSTVGLGIHSVSMVILTGFVIIRLNGFFRTGKVLSKDFEGVVEGAVGSSISEAVGEGSMKSLEFYISARVAASDPAGYARALQRIFGTGSTILVEAIVRGICSATGLEPNPKMTLASAMQLARQRFLTSGTPLRA